MENETTGVAIAAISIGGTIYTFSAGEVFMSFIALILSGVILDRVWPKAVQAGANAYKNHQEKSSHPAPPSQVQ
jgi:uncharacterized membrane-anchored protein YitT (DUF2179 family)